MADVYWTFFLLSIFKSKLFSFSFLIVHEFLLSERFSCGNAPLFTVIISVSIEHCQFFFFATLNRHSIIWVWVVCVFSLPDIDECKRNVCDQNAFCTNTQGSYHCTCSPGYIADGSNCKSGFGFYHTFQLVRTSIQLTRSELLLVRWPVLAIVSLCRIHFIKIQIIRPPFMCISAILNHLAKRFVTPFATCWSRLICSTVCYANDLFKLIIHLF